MSMPRNREIPMPHDYAEIVTRPGPMYIMRVRTMACKTCGAEFQTRTPGRKYCDKHSAGIAYRGRGGVEVGG